MDEERLIANAHGIPWHLPRDVVHFRSHTLNKWLLLGRRTYGQMLGWFKEGHVPLVLSRQKDWQPERGQRVRSVEEALGLAGAADQEELVCCGGGRVYEEAMPVADRLVLTLIAHRFPPDAGAVYFPKWDASEWALTSEKTFPPDSENAYGMRMVSMTRRAGA